MSGEPVGGAARVHLVFLRQGGLLLTKKGYEGWRQVQDEHEDYMTSLGPYDEEALLDFLRAQYGEDDSRWGFTRAEIRSFMGSDEETLKA